MVLFMLASTILGAQKDTTGGPVLNSAPAATPEIVEKGLDDKINEAIKPATDLIGSIVFYPITLPGDIKFPVVLLLLVGGALYFTLYFGFVNFRHFGTAIQTVRGKYADKVAKGADEVDAKGSVNVLDSGDIARTVANEGAHGEVSHFQALSAALSATVGLGNIAGVAVAITLGGPGATFWMILAGFLGMSSKFVECTLGVKYRDIGPDGTVYGGPMYYLSKGFAERGWVTLGKIFAVFFAIMCVGGSFGGGNMFQANQAAAQLKDVTGFAGGNSGVVFGIIMAVLVAVVIIGGIKRIGKVAETIVPFMAILYVGAALIILVVKANELPHALQLIFEGAFTAAGVTGGVIGVLFQGFKRAAFLTRQVLVLRPLHTRR
jgi:AGCS family alanine or glycine:cation symporter